MSNPAEAPPGGVPRADPAPAKGLVAPTLLFGCVLLVAGAAGVVLIAGFRLFSQTAGGTSGALSAGVAALVAGAAFGALRAAEKGQVTAAPGALLAGAAAAFGAAALLSVPVLRLARAGYLAAAPLAGTGGPALWGLRFLLGLSLFTLPAIFFFAITPLLARLIVSRPEGLGMAAGFACGLVLAGMGLGILAAPHLLGLVGLAGSGLLAVGLAGVGAAGMALLRQRGLEGEGAVGRLLLGTLGAAQEGDIDRFSPMTVTAAGMMGGAAALIGFAAWTYFLVCQRTLAFTLGPTLQGSTMSGAVFAVGLALGGLLAAGLIDRVPRPMLLLVSVLTGAALLAWGSMFFVDRIPALYLGMAPLLGRPGLSFLPAAAAAACLVLPPALLLGAALPLAPVAARAKGRSPARMALYLALGVVLAEVLTRPFIIPAFGLRRTAALAAAVAVLAALLFLGFTRFRTAATRQTAGMVLIGLMCVAGFYPASWDPRLVASGLYRYGARSLERFGSAAEYLAARQRLELIFFREGRESGVIVERTAQASTSRGTTESLALTVDGKIEATTGADLRTQVLQAHLPLLVHGTPRDVLLVDLLDGVAAGSILRHPIESLTVVEREPAMVEAAAAFAPYNGLFDESGRVADDRVRLVHDEARPWLLGRRETYDVILISGFDPWRPHSAALTTEEGLIAIRSRLREGGVAAQRLALTAVSGAGVRTVVRTFVRVFPSVLLFQISPEDLLLVGSERELALDVGWLKNVISSRGEIAEDLRRILVFGPNEILLTFRLGGEGVRGLAGEGPVDRDDLALVETAAVRDMRVHDGRLIVAALEERWTPLAPVITNYGARPEEKAEFLYGLAKVYLGMAGDPRRAREMGQEILGLGRPAMARWVMGESLLQERDIDGALAEWDGVLDVEPGNLDALFSLGTFHLDNRDYWKADPYLSKAARLHPETAVVRYHNGRNLFYLGRNEAAIGELREAVRMAGEREGYPLVPYLVGVAANRLKRDGEARESLEAYLKWAYTQPLTRVEVDAHMKLAEVYDRQGQRFQAHRERQKGEELRRRIEAQTLRARQEGTSVPEAVAPPPGGPDSLGLPPEVGGIGPGETVRPQRPPKP